MRRVREAVCPHNSRLSMQVCFSAVHFAALRDAAVPLPDLPDPFEPFLLFYGRGEGFWRDDAWPAFDDGTRVRTGRPRDHLDDRPRASMDHETPDVLDGLRRCG
ncbi:hypothetical protein [Thermomonospora cellulosilytica]|uniref:Uncharacterized protein n=1 Tax=Thermomonospora cellulosilytica TaxID=1411118 RepID=A0A7W3MTV5_9ACTN|nr:hypothetical protein [Thermomonospora cellulosilytica]MBA9001808.1 hypothetical protein [Thermomonospora cellulosilytica]